MTKIIIHKDEQFIDRLAEQVEKQQQLTNWELFQLYYEMTEATLCRSFSELRALSYLPHIEFLPHQIDTANKVMTEMNGRALLADEVGLGKTIEAGLILKEYMIRRLVKSALILVPSSLMNQWQTELMEKFFIRTFQYKKRQLLHDNTIYICSLELAKRPPHRDLFLNEQFDLVIVDEAHKLKNRNTKNYTFVKALNKKYCLLLSATPLQNKLSEIINLVSILKPGYFERDITRNEIKRIEEANEETVYIRQLLKNVMIRHRRKDLGTDSTKRHIHLVRLQFTEKEQETYDDLATMLTKYSPLAKVTFLRELCSSREACYLSLQKSKQTFEANVLTNILQKIAQLPHHTKAKEVVRLIRSFNQEKVIIFTEYQATQYYLYVYLKEHGIQSVLFHGGLRAGRKDWLKQLFEQNVQVFIATEAGGEGINLQFCRYMINYDLPWNPMRLEQRIGRIHRYGQTSDIHIYNFFIEQSIEEQIVSILAKKVDLFERAVGKLDHLLVSNERTRNTFDPFFQSNEQFLFDEMSDSYEST